MYELITFSSSGLQIIRKDGILCIPINAQNQDYKDYLVWVAQGNTATFVTI